MLRAKLEQKEQCAERESSTFGPASVCSLGKLTFYFLLNMVI